MTDRHVKAKQYEKENLKKKNEIYRRLKFKLAPSSAFSLLNVLHIFGKILYAKNSVLPGLLAEAMREITADHGEGIPLQDSQ